MQVLVRRARPVPRSDPKLRRARRQEASDLRGCPVLEPRFNVFVEVAFVDDLNLPQRLRAKPGHASSG